MHTLFTTRGAPAKKSFQLWREVLCERFVPMELTLLGDKPFEGTIKATTIGNLNISEATIGAVKTELTPSTIRRHENRETISFFMYLQGSGKGQQDGRDSSQQAGDLVIVDNRRPVVRSTLEETSVYVIEVPRSRLESVVGPATLCSSLTLDRALGSVSLATTFFKELVRVQGSIDPATAIRMSSIGIDLLVGAVAERMAREVPRGLQGDLIVQRAKAYIQANLGDPRLDPDWVAAAVGISLRRLQELFQERERSVAGWIWECRLTRAYAYLTDPEHRRLSIGTIAYNSGFVNSTHFTTRFKRRYDVTPRELRTHTLEGV